MLIENQKNYNVHEVESIFFRPTFCGKSASELGIRVIYNMPMPTTVQVFSHNSNILCDFSSGWQGGSAVERLQKELYALRGRVSELEEGDFDRKAELYADKGNVLLFEGDMSAESVRKLCDAVLHRCGGRCAVFAGSDGNYKYAIGEEGGDLRAFVKEMNAALSGRGGGKPNFAQGSSAAKKADIEAFFAK